MAFTGKGVLIVDDDPGMVELLRSYCEVLKFSHIISTTSALESLELLKRYQDIIDLVILDLVMPDLNGLEISRRIAGTHTRAIGIILISGFVNSPEIDEFLKIKSDIAHCETFLPKPFFQDTLQQKMEKVLKEVESKRQGKLSAGQAHVLAKLSNLLEQQSKEIAELREGIQRLETQSTSIKSLGKDILRATIFSMAVIFLLNLNRWANHASESSRNKAGK